MKAAFSCSDLFTLTLYTFKMINFFIKVCVGGQSNEINLM